MQEQVKGFNLKVFEFKENLIKIVNESDLPMITKNSIVKEISEQLNQVTNQSIQLEKKAYEESCKTETAEQPRK